MKTKKDFCTNCRKETEYYLNEITVEEEVRGEAVEFHLTTAICKKCGCEMDIPGLLDLNNQEMDEQYRDLEDIIPIGDIERILDIYDIGKEPLSNALGFGEVTINRYLRGQVPSKEYSDIMRKALTNPGFMKEKLKENKDKITEVAYEKAYNAATEMEELFKVPKRMLMVISYIFKKLEEVTPLMLQKLLYYVQGFCLALKGEEMFEDDCKAWQHGPVYKDVYNLFRDFKYNPIDDPRFAILDNMDKDLSEEEKQLIDLVVNTFGVYSGKTLEKITHKEEPWLDAREGYTENMKSDEPISEDSIKKFFVKLNKKYDLSKEKGINEYIREQLRQKEIRYV